MAELPPTPTTSAMGSAVPTADLNKELDKKEQQGATIHQFDPNDSPTEKARQILNQGNGVQALAPVDLTALPGLAAMNLTPGEIKAKVLNGSTSNRELKEGAGAKVTPAAEKELEKEKLEALKDTGRIDAEGAKQPPGAMPPPGAKPRDIPAWFQIGWTGQDKTFFATPDEVRAKTILSEFVSEAYYGEWYHNAGIIIFAVVASHFLTLFGAGWAWLVILLAFTATYYQTSIKRTRRNARDDMVREVALKGLKADVESATWLNLFMTRFWIIYEPVLSATIVASVDQVLSVSTPAFLDSIRMTTFTLGTKPPHIDHVRTFADTEEDVVMMEWAISFTPNDIQDMTHAQAAKKINPKIVLNIRLGVGPAVVGKDIIVEDLSFKGVMRIRMKLMSNFPHVQLVDLSFNSPPEFDFVLKPVGFDLSIIPGLTPFIFSQVHGILGPMMYSPNVFTLNLEQLLSGAPLDTAIGVLAVTVYNGRGLKGTKLGGGSPDPYVSLSVAGRVDVAKTEVKKSTATPRWNETKFIVLNTLNDVLSLGVRDWNEHRPDSNLGAVTFDLKSLLEDGQQEGLHGEVILDGKPRGIINYDAVYYPVLTPKKLEDGTMEPIPATKTGVVRLIIHQAKDLDPRGQQINPYATVLLNDQVVHRSQTLKRTPSPVWERAAEFLVTEKSSAVLSVKIQDENSLVFDTSLGHVKIKLDDLLEANAKGQDWFQLSRVKSGRVRLSAQWKPVLMAGAQINGSASYTPPIGIIRLWFKRARDLKNVEALTGGKSDPYARVLLYGFVIARTMIINNNLDPEWDEIVYIQLHNPADNFTVEVMDYEHQGKDRPLGNARVSFAGLLKEGTDKKNKPWVSTGPAQFNEGLKGDRKTSIKGNIEFEAEFFPCAHLKNVSFHEPPSNSISEVTEEEEEEEEVATSNGSTISTPPLPVGNGTAMATSQAGTSTTSVEALTSEQKDEGIVVPREELLRTQSGILVFQIISGQLARKGARLEVLFDDGYWPAYSTEPARSPHAKWDEIGEVFIRELDFATVHLKLNTAEKETREDVIAAASIDMNVFLENCLDKPYNFTMTDPNGGNRSVISMAAKYIPVEIELLARESVNNSGQLRVDLLDAKDIPAVDRSGKSDPYAVFLLNGVKVHKSEVHKKTLSPVFNESFEAAISSRVAAEFTLELFDWDRLGSSTRLGQGSINLAELEPMEQTEVTVKLTDSKTGKPGGTVRIKMVFRPGFLAKSRAATSTLSVAGRVATSLGGGVLGVGSGVVGAGTSGIGAVGKAGFGAGKGVLGGIGGGVRRLVPGSSNEKSSNNNLDSLPEDIPPVPEVPIIFANDIAAPPATQGAGSAPASPSKTPPRSGTNGILSVSVSQVEGFGEEHTSEKKFISIRKAGKEVDHTHSAKGDPAVFNEEFKIPTMEGPCVLEFGVVHKKFAGSSTIGTGLLDVWEAISISAPKKEVCLVVGEGKLNLSLSWTDADVGSIASKARSRLSFGARSKRESSEPNA